MQFLFIYIGGEAGQKFDPEKLKRDLAEIEGVSDINGENLTDSVVACHYKFGGYRTTMRLSEGLETVSTNHYGEADWNLALELQKREPRPLRIFNDDYDFHFSLKGIKSLDELKQKIAESYFDDEAKAMEARSAEVG